MKTAVIQMATRETRRFAEVTLPHNASYCKRHGYKHVVLRDRLSKRWPGWDKVELIKQHLNRFDRLFILDVDAVFMNFRKPLEHFAKGSDKDMAICQDDGDLRDYRVNTGAILLTPKDVGYWSRVCDRWWDLGRVFGLEHKYFHEQSILAVMLILDDMGLQGRCHVAPSDAFNGRNWWDPQKPGDPSHHTVLHWMGAGPEERRTVLAAAARLVKKD